MIVVSVRETLPGDQVVVLLPIPGQPLQTRFQGPCVVEKQLGPEDYVIALPDHQLVIRLNPRDLWDSRDAAGSAT